MGYNHDFICNDHAPDLYSVVVFCKKCGLVAYHTNKTSLMDKNSTITDIPCPYPDKEQLDKTITTKIFEEK